MGVHERVFPLQPRQAGTFRPPRQLADAMVHGLRRARIYISLSSDRLDNAFDFRGLTAREWRQNGVRATEMLDKLARMLNSNEQFEMNDSFQLAFVYVHCPPVGTGQKRYLPGTSPPNGSRP